MWNHTAQIPVPSDEFLCAQVCVETSAHPSEQHNWNLHVVVLVHREKIVIYF